MTVWKCKRNLQLNNYRELHFTHVWTNIVKTTQVEFKKE